MQFLRSALTAALISVGGVAPAFAQIGEIDSLVVPFSQPSRPGFIRIGVIQGGITVTGYNGRDVIVTARPRSLERYKDKMRDGLRLIPNTSTGLTVEEEDNQMIVSVGSHSRVIDVEIKAPRKTSLKLSTTNAGKIIVENIEGEVEANNSNGSIEMRGISGAVVAYSANGRVTVEFDKILPDKAMSFVTMNGTIDVTFPPSLKADAKLRTDNGNVYTDFDVEIRQNVRKVENSSEKSGRRYRVALEKDMLGKINGGGPEMEFRTLNGNIYIRKKK